MTFKMVRVGKPANRLIYIDGGYEDPAGNSSGGSFAVPTGGHVFETLNGNRCVDNRKRIRVQPTDDDPLSIDLDGVDPPEPIV
jgi:hypothetical protein